MCLSQFSVFIIFLSVISSSLGHQSVASVDILRCDNSDYNLAIPSLRSSPQVYKSLKRQKSVPTFGKTNAFATYVIVAITLLNIIVHKLIQSYEEDSRNRNVQLPSFEKQCRIFSISEIRLATNNFDEDLFLGRGGFGMVYKGLLNDGAMSTVAVKRLNSKSRQGAKEFWTEIEMLSNFRHSHLVSLIGYCNEAEEMILVYEYMSQGTLSDHLYKNCRNGLVISQPLSWERRLKICIGVARGLDYLHTGTGLQQRVIHRDVKSSNILLDEHWEAKVSDFGLSKIGPANQSCSHVSTNVKGTLGYMDPEYFLTHRLTRKSDVYAFGVVLFEVLCGRRAMDMRIDVDQQALARYAHRCIQEGTIDQIIDSTLKEQISKDCLKVFVEIGDQCLFYEHHKRPTMADVIAKLELALELQKRTQSVADHANLINTVGVLENLEDNIGGVLDYLEDNIGGVLENPEDNIGGIVENQRNFPSLKMKNKGMLKLVARKVYKVISRGKKSIAKKNADIGISSRQKPNNLESYGRARTLSTESSSFAPRSLSEETQIRQFSFLTIQDATDSLNAGLILSHGHRGIVFKGHIDCDHTEVAIKELNLTSEKRGYETFRNDILHTKINHFNVLPLIGFCREDIDELYLVSKYMSNGSLEYHLHNNNNDIYLTWNLRLQICIGVAKGLDHLHRGIVGQIMTHGRIRPNKILLDENWIPKISGYGLWKLGTSLGKSDFYLHYEEKVAQIIFWETWAYMSPEQKAEEVLTTKSDVYSMGVLMLNVLFDWRRIITSLDSLNRAPDGLYNWVKSNIRDRSLVSFMDSNVAGKVTPECLAEIIDIAFHCLMKNKNERPTMENVVKRLECAYDLQTNHTSNFPVNGDKQLERALQNRLQTSHTGSLDDNDHHRMRRWGLNDAVRMNSWSLIYDMSIANFDFDSMEIVR